MVNDKFNPMYDDAKIANQNNRNLQNSIRGFRNRKLQSENRPIKSFPKLHPKEAIEYQKKMRRIGFLKRTISFVTYALVFITVLIIVYRLQ